jgi:hypothetical protein
VDPKALDEEPKKVDGVVVGLEDVNGPDVNGPDVCMLKLNNLERLLIYVNTFSYPEPFLRAVRRGALAKSISELMDMARAPRRTARKKGSGYENDVNIAINIAGFEVVNLQLSE